MRKIIKKKLSWVFCLKFHLKLYNNQQITIWGRRGKKWLWPNLRYHPRILLTELTKTHKKKSYDRCSADYNLNTGPFEYKAQMQNTWLQRSILSELHTVTEYYDILTTEFHKTCCFVAFDSLHTFILIHHIFKLCYTAFRNSQVWAVGRLPFNY
jgi:hypothetical protein